MIAKQITHIFLILRGGVLISSYTTCNHALIILNLQIDTVTNIDHETSDFFSTCVIHCEYNSSSNSEFITYEFAVNELNVFLSQTYPVYFILNNVCQIRNISIKIESDYITTDTYDLKYYLYNEGYIFVLFFIDNNNFINTSNNALMTNKNQINIMNIFNGLFNNEKLNYYLISKYNYLSSDGYIEIAPLSFNLDESNMTNEEGSAIVGIINSSNVSDFFITNNEYINSSIIQYITFVVSIADDEGNLSFRSMLVDESNTKYYYNETYFDKFINIFSYSWSDHHRLKWCVPLFTSNNNFNDTVLFYPFSNSSITFDIFRTSYTNSPTTNSYINFRSVSDNVTQSIVLPSNMSQCINNSMSFAHFKVENLNEYFYDEITQIQPLSYYIKSNTTINFTSNIDPSILLFDSTNKIFTLNGVFAVFATAEIGQKYNNYDVLINTGYSLVIKMGFSSSGPFFFTKIASLFETSNTDYSFVASDFSMINALEGITSELYINNIKDSEIGFESNSIGIENLELFFLQLS